MTVTAMAHTGVCVADVDEAVAYRDVLGMTMAVTALSRVGRSDPTGHGEDVPGLSLKAAIVGFDRSDHVLRARRIPHHTGHQISRRLNDSGISHLGLLCDDLAITRAELEDRGVRFLTSGLAGIAGLRTTWSPIPTGRSSSSCRKGLHPHAERGTRPSLLAPAHHGGS